MASIGLFNNGIDKDGTLFEQAELQAALSDAQMEADMALIRNSLTNIPFIPLKGIVLKQYYSESYMRTCGDIDILIHEVDTKRAVAALTEHGFKAESYNYHDVALVSENGTMVELHFSLSCDSEKMDKVLDRVWDYAVVKNGCEYKLTDDFFFFYILSHLAHHFYPYGCGIRFFMDLWVIQHRMEIKFDEKVKELCKEAGIETFAETAIKLSEAWFGDMSHDELTKAMEEYVLTSGTFGNTDNVVAVTTGEKRGSVRHNLKRMLLPYSKLKLIYPEMKPIQFPIYEVRRWGELLNRGLNRRKSMSEKSVSDEKKEKVRQLMERLDIKQ
ncbi:MAG: nucleotidyltransferase family protein [Oscillospiraceae bacterium]|nr:nucleotidyltransferase family protein [Oscillospiraceae bacterium]